MPINYRLARLIFLIAALFLVQSTVSGASVFSSWPSVPTAPQTQTQSVARKIIFNGLDMRASVFHSARSPAEFIAYYRKLWNNKIVVNQVGSAHVVGHRDGSYFITVQVQTEGSGSKGSIGIVDIGHAPKKVDLGKGLPKPAGSVVFNDIRYPDDPTPSRMIALINSLSPRQNVTYYREHLEANQWKPISDHCAAKGCVLSFHRGNQKMNLAISRFHLGHSQLVAIIQNP